jgi:Domain of unknown function (DUF5919)
MSAHKMPWVGRLWGQAELYLTMVISLVVGVLGMLDVVNPEMLAGATLATLGLVAAASLGARSQLTSLAGTTADLATLVRELPATGTSADRLLSGSTSGLDVELSCAQDIRIVGVTLCRTIRNVMLTLQHRLEHGAAVRIALIEPSRGALLEAARRSTVPDAPEIFANRLRPTIDLLRQLTAAAGHTGRLEIRLLSFVPAFGMIIVDPDEAHGRIHVDIYSHRSAVTEPTLPLRADRDQRWYRHFRHEFDRIWATGRPFDASAGPQWAVTAAGGPP